MASEPTTVAITLRGVIPGTISELARHIAQLSEAADDFSCFLAALLHGAVLEVPIIVKGQLLFAAPYFVDDQDDDLLADLTKSFLQVRNLLLAFTDDAPLSQRVAANADRIVSYAARLAALSLDRKEFADALNRRREHARILSQQSETVPTHSHAIRLLNSLAEECDWTTLESFARRYAESPDQSVALNAKRKLALALAHHDTPAQRREGAALAKEMAISTCGTASDFAVAITVFHALDDDAQARALLLASFERFPKGTPELFEIGYRLVIDSGDAGLRAMLDAARSGGSSA
jgi:hypothetical protein